MLIHTGGCRPTDPENTHSDVSQIEQTRSERLIYAEVVVSSRLRKRGDEELGDST